jgi:hypothetical protein
METIMSVGVLKVSEIPSEKSEITELAFASQMMRERIAPIGSAASKGERVRLSARRLKWKSSRARDVWYAEPRVSLKPSELRQIEGVSGVKYLELARSEALAHADLITRVEALLVGNEATFASALLSALRSVAGQGRGP